MVAHLDEVTCVAFDPNGLYVLSGSELTVHLNFYLNYYLYFTNEHISVQVMIVVFDYGVSKLARAFKK